MEPDGIDPDAALSQAKISLAAARLTEAQALAEPLFRHYRDAGQWHGAAQAALIVSRASGTLRQVEASLRWGMEAVQAAQQSGSLEVECAAWVTLACEQARQEHAGQAQQAVDEVLRLVPALQAPAALEAAFTGLTTAYSEMGLTLQAVQFARQAVAAACTLDSVAQRASARANLLVIGAVACELLKDNDPPAAATLLGELQPHLAPLAAETAEVASPLAQARYHRVAAGLHNCAGEWQQALHELQALLDLPLSLPPHLASSAWIELGLVHRRLGHAAQALAAGERAAAFNPVPSNPQRAVDLRRLAMIEDLCGHSDRALALYKRYQDRRHYIVINALDSRAAILSAKLEEQALRLENSALRQQNAGLSAGLRRMGRLAATDPLTGLLNRRELELQFATLAASGRAVVLVMLDVDHFKRVNDEHSHTVGDAVLRELAQLMQAALRGHDVLARYGGEEFTALMVDCQPGQAASGLERLRQKVLAHHWVRLAPGLAVTFSAGFSPVNAGDDFEAVVSRADALLYAAKKSGRNRIVGAATGFGAP